MPGNDKHKKNQKIAPSSINLDLVRDQFLTFYRNATSSSDGSTPWPIHSIKRSLDLPSYSAGPSIDSPNSNEPVNITCKASSSKSSVGKVPETSIFDQDSRSPTFRLDKVFHLSTVGLCPADMSPPADTRLLKGKLKRNRRSSWTSDSEDLPQKKPYENVDEKSDSDIDDESSLSPSQTPKVPRLSVRDLSKEFSPEIEPISSAKEDENYEIVSYDYTSDETEEKSNSDECGNVESNNSGECENVEVGESNSDEKFDEAVDSDEDSAELFRSPRRSTRQKQAEPPTLLTPRTDKRATRSSTRLSSARKLFPTQAEKVEPQTPRTPKSTRLRKVNVTPKVNVKLLTPSRGRVESPLRTPTTPRDKAKHALALSAAPESLPCRGKEFQTVYDFVREKISSKESGVLCINGVPGSGKTATIRRVLKKLKAETEKKILNEFKAIEVNAFDLRKSKEIYRKIHEQLTGDRKTVTIAEQLLTERFQSLKRNARRIPIVLIIDEFDCLLTKKRDVIYKMVEWQANDNSQLVLLTIANKLDFSDEKKLFSRIKFERLAFVAYSFQELEIIIKDRLKEFHGFKPEAIQFIARKVAATSGDARKALDICRQVLDTVEAENENFVFTIDYVSKLLEKIFSNPNVRIIKQLTDLEKIALRALRDELLRTDKSFCTLWNGVWHQFEAICNMDGFTRINCNSLLQMYAYLASIGLVKIETDHLDQHSKIWLKCDTDVIKVALK